jgi:hypothetical protein
MRTDCAEVTYASLLHHNLPPNACIQIAVTEELPLFFLLALQPIVGLYFAAL